MGDDDLAREIEDVILFGISIVYSARLFMTYALLCESPCILGPGMQESAAVPSFAA